VARGPSYREAKGGAPRLDRCAGWWNRFPAFRVWLRSSAIRCRPLPLLGARVKGAGQECPLNTNLGCSPQTGGSRRWLPGSWRGIFSSPGRGLRKAWSVVGWRREIPCGRHTWNPALHKTKRGYPPRSSRGQMHRSFASLRMTKVVGMTKVLNRRATNHHNLGVLRSLLSASSRGTI